MGCLLDIYESKEAYFLNKAFGINIGGKLFAKFENAKKYNPQLTIEDYLISNYQYLNKEYNKQSKFFFNNKGQAETSRNQLREVFDEVTNVIHSGNFYLVEVKKPINYIEKYKEEILKDAAQRVETSEMSGLFKTEDGEISSIYDELDVEVDPDELYKKEVSRIEKVINKLKSGLINKSDAEKEIVKQQIKELEKDIENIESKKNIGILLQNASKHINLAEKLANTGNLETSRTLIKPYLHLLNTFTLLDNNDIQLRNEIFNKINDILNSINVKELAKASKYLGDSSIIKTYNGTTKAVPFVAENTLNTTVFDASKSKNPVVRLLNKKIKDLKNRINNLLVSFKSEHFKILQDLKNEQKGEKDIFSYMIQKDKNDKPTGYIINEANAAYRELEKDSKYIRGSENKTQFIKYLKFLKKTTDFTIDKNLWENKKQAIAEFVDKDTVVKPNEKLTLDEKKLKRIKSIETSSNPNRFVELLNKDIDKLNGQELAFMQSYFDESKYMINGESILVKSIKNEYKDKQYLELMSLPDTNAKKRYYNFFKDTLYKGRKDLSPYFTDVHLAYNYIPELEKETPLWNDLQSPFRTALSLRPETHSSNVIDTLTGEPTYSIPFHMLSGKVKPEMKSYQLDKVLNTFQEQYLNKKLKEESEDNIKEVLSVIKNQEEYVLNKDGSIHIENGIPVTKISDNNTAYLQAKYLIDSELYGKRQDKEVQITSVKFRKKEVRDRLKELETLATERPLTDEEQKEYNQLKNDYSVLTGSKMVNALMSWTAKKNLAFNFFGGFTETIQGLSSISIESAAGEFFNDNDFKKALGLTLNDFKPFAFDKSKTAAIVKNFNLLDDFGLELGEQGFLDKYGYLAYKKAEQFTKGILANSILNAEKVYKGKEEFALLDVIEVNDNGLLTIAKGYTDKSGKELSFGEYTENGYEISQYKSDLTNKINQLSKRLISRDNSKDPILMNKNALYRLLGQFRASWLFEGLSRRFGEETQDEILGTKVRGFYRPVFQLAKEGRIQELLYTVWAARYNPSALEGKFTPQDIADFKRVCREMTTIAMLYGLYLVFYGLKNASDDDDEWFKDATFNALINQFYRSSRDMSFYVNPKSGLEIFKDVFPAQKTLNDAWEFTMAVKDVPLGDLYVNEGKSNEELKLINRGKRIIPYLGGGLNTYSKFEDIIQSAK